MTKVPSPCNGVCKIGQDGLCKGCLRTREEIAGWSAMDPRRRDEVMAMINHHKADRALVTPE